MNLGFFFFDNGSWYIVKLFKSSKCKTEKGLHEAYTRHAFRLGANRVTFCFTTTLDPPMKLQSLIKLTLLLIGKGNFCPFPTVPQVFVASPK